MVSVRLALGTTLAALLLSPAASAQVIQVKADFALGADYPLIKDKFNLYNTSVPSTADFQRDAKLLDDLNVETLRIEQCWGFGQTLSHTIGGIRGALTFDWTEADRWQKTAFDHGVLLHTGYDYTPYPLGIPQDVPPEPDWTDIVGRTWQHLHDTKMPVVINEVWNEPDFNESFLSFFHGSQDDYQGIFERTSQKIRSLDRDAKIAGPVTARNNWFSGFVDFVAAKKLPLDVFSFHQYTHLGNNGDATNDHTEQIAKLLGANHYFDKTELVMGEYNTYLPWPAGGPQEKFVGATALLADFLRLLERTDLTSLNWAQFQEPGRDTSDHIGLLTWDGHPKAVYNAFRLYGMMPVDRAGVTVSGGALAVAASSDSHRIGILVLNPSDADQDVVIGLANPPFATGTVRVYPIDGAHNSFLDGAGEALTASSTLNDVAMASFTYTGKVAKQGSLAFIVDDASGMTTPKSISLGDVIRVNRYYPTRAGASRGVHSYSDFDRRTWVARFGMVQEDNGDQEVGVTAEHLPSVLYFVTTAQGPLKTIDRNSLLGVRMDFEVGGAYARSVLFHGPYAGGSDLYDPARDAAMPFGTEKQADQVVKVANFAEFSVVLGAYAPPGASGRVQITYILQNAGKGSRAVIRTVGGTGSAAIDGGRAFGQDASMGGNTGGALADGGNVVVPNAGNGPDASASIDPSHQYPAAASDESGCACRFQASSRAPGAWGWLLVAAAIAARGGTSRRRGRA